MSRGDESLAERVRQSLEAEPLLGDCFIDSAALARLQPASVLFPEGYSGHIRFTVDDGVVTLRGEVSDQAERRLAARRARVGGCRRVVNAIRLAGGPAREAP